MTHPKAARISPDSQPIAYGAAGLATAIYLGAFVSSFFGQASLAAYMLIPHDLQYVVPAVVDLGLVLFTLATLVRKARGESTMLTNMATGFWTLVSITANIFHVLIPAGPQSSWTAGTYAGAALSALMPLAALGASLVIENVLIARPTSVSVSDPAEETESVIVQKNPVTTVPAILKAEPKIAPPNPLPVAAAAAAAPPMAAVKVPPAAPRTVTAPAAAALESSLPAPQKAPERQPVQGLEIDWVALSKAEQADLVCALKEEGMSIPKIAAKAGVSVSTIKRIPARELQPS
jgi:hypothetical protein